jgi:hypothetical protein
MQRDRDKRDTDDDVPMTPPEAYNVLQLSETASVEEIEAAYAKWECEFRLNPGWIKALTTARDTARGHKWSGRGLILGESYYLTDWPESGVDTSTLIPEPPQSVPGPAPVTATRPSRTVEKTGSKPSDYKGEWLPTIGDFMWEITSGYLEAIGPIFLVIGGFGLFVLLLKALL